MRNLITRLVRDEEGQDLVEYALLIAFVSLAAIAGMQALGGGINEKFSQISQSLNGS